jgi:hypothetical protein
MTRIAAMNFASDGADEASPAAKAGEMVKPARTAVATVIEKTAADLQLNSTPFRLTCFR